MTVLHLNKSMTVRKRPYIKLKPASQFEYGQNHPNAKRAHVGPVAQEKKNYQYISSTKHSKILCCVCERERRSQNEDYVVVNPNLKESAPSFY